jgi:hypothetical protein
VAPVKKPSEKKPEKKAGLGGYGNVGKDVPPKGDG